MSVSFAPNWGEELGNSLSGIASGIRGLADPDWKLREKLKLDLTDPSKMQDLVNMFSQNPDSVRSIPGMDSNLLNTISSAKADPGYLAKLGIGNASLDRLKDPAISKDAANVALGLRPEAGRQVEANNAATSNIDREKSQTTWDFFRNLDVPTQRKYIKNGIAKDYGSLSDEELKKYDLDLQGLEEQQGLREIGNNWIKKHPDANPLAIAKITHLTDPNEIDAAMKANDLDWTTLGALQAHKNFGPVLEQLDNTLKEQERFNQQNTLQTNSINASGARQDKSLENQANLQDKRLAAADKIRVGKLEAGFTASIQRTIDAMNDKNKKTPPDQVRQTILPALQQQLDALWEAKGRPGEAPKLEYGYQEKSALGVDALAKDVPIIKYRESGSPESKVVNNLKDLVTPKDPVEDKNKPKSNDVSADSWKALSPAQRAEVKTKNPAAYDHWSKLTGVQ